MTPSLLPSQGDRDWVIAQLRALLDRAGRGRFLDGGIVEPTDAFFPDHWTGDVAAVRAIASRLLGYAGLPRACDVELFDPDDLRVEVGRHGVTTAWYAGRADGRCRFGVAQHRLEDPATVVFVLAHEVAHAFRDWHRLEVADRDLEEHLTDLTAVYLGFGLLVASGASRYRTEAVEVTGMAWSDTRMGYLPAPTLAFALAVQARAREATREEERRLARHLDADQAGSFGAALAALDETAVRAALLGDPADVLSSVSAQVDAIFGGVASVVTLPPPPRRRSRYRWALAAVVLLALAAAAVLGPPPW